jgi:AraC-like DNA-binding protein
LTGDEPLVVALIRKRLNRLDLETRDAVRQYLGVGRYKRKRSLEQVAQRLGVNPSQVKRLLSRVFKALALTATCWSCGAEFTVKRHPNLAKFCSTRCMSRYHYFGHTYRPRAATACLQCGKSLRGKLWKARFCSDHCRHVHGNARRPSRSRAVVKVCPCGTEFEVCGKTSGPRKWCDRCRAGKPWGKSKNKGQGRGKSVAPTDEVQVHRTRGHSCRA